MPIDDVPSLTGRTRARDHDSVMGSLRFSDDIQADSTFAHERGNHRHDLQPRFRQAVSGTDRTPCRKQSTGTTAARERQIHGLLPMDYLRWITPDGTQYSKASCRSQIRAIDKGTLIRFPCHVASVKPVFVV